MCFMTSLLAAADFLLSHPHFPSLLPFSSPWEADGSFIRTSPCKLLDDTNQMVCIRCRLGQKMEAKDNNEAQLADKHV